MVSVADRRKRRAVQQHTRKYWLERDRFPIERFFNENIVDFPLESWIFTLEGVPV